MPENGSETGKTMNRGPAKHPEHRNAQVFATLFAGSESTIESVSVNTLGFHLEQANRIASSTCALNPLLAKLSAGRSQNAY